LQPAANKKDSLLIYINQINFDDSSFELFFKENYLSLCVHCQYKFHFSIDESEEVVHLGFIKLWETRNTISPDLPIKPYLYTIITNICLNIIRHNKVKQKYHDYIASNSNPASTKNDFDNAELNELKKNIDWAVSQLPQQMREIFEMSRYHDLKYAEIASRLNISIKTVETQMSRALVKLRHMLSPYLTICFFVIRLLA
jgi:RNA polymerase sigma-70 factor (ECF subfamily)